MNSQISLCYHPTKVVLVDDNFDFINAISLELLDTFRCQIFDNPSNALAFITNEYQFNPFTQRCFLKPSQEKADHLYLDVDLRQIREEINIKERFNEIAVMVVDYTMPEMNGLALCEQLKSINPYLCIILLTGEADHDLAVHAFNEGLIDQFIKKSTKDLTHILIQSIKQLQRKYFLQLSQAVLDRLDGTLKKLKRLHDPKIINLFNNLCQEHQIEEYYLLDSTGSFLLIDKAGNPKWFALLNQHELNDFYQDAELEQASSSVISALKNHEKVPFFYSEGDLFTPPTEWEPYLHPAKQIIGLDTYYYAVIENNPLYEWRSENTFLYPKYLRI